MLWTVSVNGCESYYCNVESTRVNTQHLRCNFHERHTRFSSRSLVLRCVSTMFNVISNLELRLFSNSTSSKPSGLADEIPACRRKGRIQQRLLRNTKLKSELRARR